MISFKCFIALISLAFVHGNHPVVNEKNKYRIFHLRHGTERNDRFDKKLRNWQAATTVNVDTNVDVTIGCDDGEGWSVSDTKSGKSKSNKCGKSKSAKSKSAKVPTYMPTYYPTYGEDWPIIPTNPTLRPSPKPTRRPTTSKPTPISTSPPTTKSLQPTQTACVPLDPNPYSFEPPNNVFPKPPWTTGGDGEWTIDDSSSYTGKYSIRSPNFDGSPVLQISNATLTVCDDYAGGPLIFRVIASVLPPQDNFIVYVDGTVAAQITDVREWTEVKLELSSGAHKIDFSYRYNLFNLDPLPPAPPTILGGVWIDSVSLGNDFPPGSLPPTTPPFTAAPIVAPTMAPTVKKSRVPTTSPVVFAPTSNQPTFATSSPTTGTSSPTKPVTSGTPTIVTSAPGTTSPTPAVSTPTTSPPTPTGDTDPPTTPPPTTLPPTPPPNAPPTPPTQPPTKNPIRPPTQPPTRPPTQPPTPPPTRPPTLNVSRNKACDESRYTYKTFLTFLLFDIHSFLSL